MSEKLKPEEALALIKSAAASGNVEFASDMLTAQYNDEIQRIFAALRIVERGAPPTRCIWTADGQPISTVLDGTDAEKMALCAAAGAKLGITLRPDMIWEDAGAELRSHERSNPD